jgi:uncharacterized membrane protein YbaN (DUF454 family)
MGWVFVVLGVVGVFLPVVPTVPFLIVAAFFFSRGSPRLHAWLHSRAHYGPMVKRWEETGVIPRRVKWIATVALLVGIANTWIFVDGRIFLKAGASLAMGGALVFIWTRPES